MQAIEGMERKGHALRKEKSKKIHSSTVARAVHALSGFGLHPRGRVNRFRSFFLPRHRWNSCARECAALAAHCSSHALPRCVALRARKVPCRWWSVAPRSTAPRSSPHSLHNALRVPNRAPNHCVSCRCLHSPRLVIAVQWLNWYGRGCWSLRSRASCRVSWRLCVQPIHGESVPIRGASSFTTSIRIRCVAL